MRQIYQWCILIAVLMMIALPARADLLNSGWEKQISENLSENSKATEVLWLGAKENKFLALYTRQTSDVAHGAAIILHTMGAHAEWPQIISPIRTLLPEQGWTSLSIQLPVIAPVNQIEDYGKTVKQAAERIKSAVRYLRERKFLNIVIIGHGFGAVSALAYLKKAEKQKIVALVAIGLQDYAFVKPSIDLLKLIEKSKIPILDIYGSRDFKKVIDQAPDRWLAAKKGNNQQYTQIEIEGADHYLNKMEDVLVKSIRGWLDKAAPGMSIMVDEDFDGNLDDVDEADEKSIEE